MNKIKNTEYILSVKGLKKSFPIYDRGVFFKKHIGDIHAINDVEFNIGYSETLGLVGESGSGKTTLGRCLLHLEKLTEGNISFKELDFTNINISQLNSLRKEMQIVFQDPYASLNPRMTCSQIIGEPLKVHNIVSTKEEYEIRIKELFDLVGLNHSMANRYPHEFSGGQRQRLGIARALALNPNFIVCDEPVSSLDVSIQAQIINLLIDLQSKLNISYLFISHDLAVVRQISHRVAVMYLGKLVEIGDSDQVYSNPLHPYTQALLSSIPIPDPVKEKKRKRIILKGEPPHPMDPPSGCVFRTRCPIADEECSRIIPPMVKHSDRHEVACLKVS